MLAQKAGAFRKKAGLNELIDHEPEPKYNYLKPGKSNVTEPIPNVQSFTAILGAAMERPLNFGTRQDIESKRRPRGTMAVIKSPWRWAPPPRKIRDRTQKRRKGTQYYNSKYSIVCH